MSDEFPSHKLEKFIVRLPDGMRDRLKAIAEENKRSTNAEIVARLEASFASAAPQPFSPTPEQKETFLDLLAITLAHVPSGQLKALRKELEVGLSKMSEQEELLRVAREMRSPAPSEEPADPEKPRKKPFVKRGSANDYGD